MGEKDASVNNMNYYPEVGNIVNFLEESEEPETLEVHKLLVTEVNKEEGIVIGTVNSDHPKQGKSMVLPVSRIR